MRLARLVTAIATLMFAPLAQAQTVQLKPVEGDYIAKDFTFRSGEKLAELRLHYTTLGTPHRNAKGEIDNAVLILHGTGGDGKSFFRPQFADVLFAPGGLLDPAKYFIVLRDGIGHGKSSKPSDGLRMAFPKYDYDDMVAADHALLTQGLGVKHARLIMGTSMGCMHSFVWGEMYPEFMDALMPLACQPTAIAGRNRVWRKLLMDGITSDPAWQGGNYTTQPLAGLRTAESMLLLAGAAPIVMQQQYPTREAADAYAESYVATNIKAVDANDLLYQVASSRNYDPSAGLETIKAPLVWVNSADDFINPPELGLAEQFTPRLKTGRYVLIPASAETRGHGTHTWAALWKDELAALLKQSERR
jgi:homoserine O-acetyltransferase/O-succinyltransferase